MDIQSHMLVEARPPKIEGEGAAARVCLREERAFSGKWRKRERKIKWNEMFVDVVWVEGINNNNK